MKKIIPFIVLWVFLSGSGGYFFVFKLKQYVNYYSIKREINRSHNDLARKVFVINPGEGNSLKWIKKQKEFIYHGQMYDVVNIIAVGKQVHYYCISDTKEKKLITDFQKRNRADDHSNQMKRKVIQSHFILSSPSSKTFMRLFACCYSQPVCYYHSPFENTLSPPPKQIRLT